MSHPDKINLVAYGEQPDAVEYGEIRSHLLDCDTCRKVVSELQEIRTALPGLYLSELNFSDLNSDDELIYSETFYSETLPAYFLGKLGEDKGLEIKRILEQDPAAQKAALHYLSHHSAMQREGLLAELVKEGAESKAEVPVVAAEVPVVKEAEVIAFDSRKSKASSTINKILEWQQPVWMTAPLAASVAFFVIYFAAFDGLNEKAGPTLAQYQDTPGLYWTSPAETGAPSANQLPGMGFFHEASEAEVSKPELQKDYQGLSVEVDASNRIQLSWQPIPDAQRYQYSLYQVTLDDKTLVFEQESDINQLEFVLDTISYDKRYEWTLMGHTGAGKQFSASGGFVFLEK